MRVIFGFVVGLLLTALSLEAAFQLLPVVSGLRLQSTSPAIPFNRYLPQLRYTYSFGWAMANARRGATNLQGFNNSPDFADQARALVIGDSFIESLMLDYPQTVQGRLAELSGAAVYAASASGNGLADSLEIARYYAPRLHPRNIVLFVEENDISGLLDQPGRGHSGFKLDDGSIRILHEPYHESDSKQLMLRSALFRYAYYNLKLRDWVSTTKRAAAGAPKSDDGASKAAVLDYYFAQLHILGKNNDIRFIFLVDGDRNAVYAGKRQGPAWKGTGLPAFVALARAQGFDVVDMQPEFQRHWAEFHERMDYMPMDGHWNSVAHELAARLLAQQLQ
ncbi:hypothetical protein [Rugamonas rubra]|uniref:SGNH hydrolase-like domain-containing protein, acetyltransferase AlgX n=1 Tax=Rugamonas rubra TaxID=758825 RepID=A0A1I4KZ54_9BURK|nr:hypothetical protein [Rugamonas rubra]SFL84045.1 hypothetical protein SAMN02982985_01730 [Rugamonas rubra]